MVIYYFDIVTEWNTFPPFLIIYAYPFSLYVVIQNNIIFVYSFLYYSGSNELIVTNILIKCIIVYIII